MTAARVASGGIENPLHPIRPDCPGRAHTAGTAPRAQKSNT